MSVLRHISRTAKHTVSRAWRLLPAMDSRCQLRKGISANEGGIHGNYSVLTGGLFSHTNALSFLWALQVTNVDDEGNELGSGVMELTQTELILHTHKRDAVRWPYLCLRRYGYDSNLFSFESGRRCQTGQGECGAS